MKIFDKFPQALGKLPLLDMVKMPSDLRKFSVAELLILADEVREFFIYTVGKNGGHFGSSLGAVELTIALHYAFDTPADKLVWDTGHQCYIHKILTGRKDQISTIRKKGGLAPFLDRFESEFDVFGAGHAGTAISVATGMALGVSENSQQKIVAIVGDGGLTCGITFEALNFFGTIKNRDLLVIFNDNEMSISENVHSIDYEQFFRSFGADYIGLIDGHNLPELIAKFRELKQQRGFKILHIKTKKGAGFLPAELDSKRLHALTTEPKSGLSYSDIFGQWTTNKAKIKDFVVLSPAMGSGSGLDDFSKQYPERFFDVGIAEQNCVAVGSGIALTGRKVIVAIYSTFLQRAYDQLINEVCINKLPLIFAIDRAGLVGGDGKTHHGVFDVAFLRVIPELVLMAPSNELELVAMLNLAYMLDKPVGIRIPRGEAQGLQVQDWEKTIEFGKARKVFDATNTGKKGVILSFGVVLEQAKIIAMEFGLALYDMRFIKPLDEQLLLELAAKFHYCITIEEVMVAGGAGSAVNEFFASRNRELKMLHLGLPDEFIEHGKKDEVLEGILDIETLQSRVREFLR